MLANAMQIQVLQAQYHLPPPPPLLLLLLLVAAHAQEQVST